MAAKSSAAGGKIGLALAGGGPEGAVYEIGVLRALEEFLVGVDFNDLHVYVGVSAGAFVGANLVNGISPSEMVRTIAGPDGYSFNAKTFFTPLISEYVKRGLMMPRLLMDAFVSQARHFHTPSLADSLARLSAVLPIAIYDNEPIRRYLHELYSHHGRTDDFRELAHRLIVVAAELDTGAAVRFGEPGLDHIEISRSITASAALPGLYPPVMIDGRHYVDGVLLKTLHASVALDAGAELVFCINPIVPVDMCSANGGNCEHANGNGHGNGHGLYRNGNSSFLMEHGLPSVLSQTFRTMIHSRLTVGLAAYTPRYPDRDVVLFEPERHDEKMFFTNVFSFADRRVVCEHAYDRVRFDLLRRYEVLAPIFEKHGVAIDKRALADPTRDLWSGVGMGHALDDEPVTATLDRLLTRLESMVDEGA